MTNANERHTGISRRGVLKNMGGVAGGVSVVGLATQPAAAQKVIIHEKWARQAAQQVKDETGNDNILVDAIADAAKEPDENGYSCPDDYPWYVCWFLDEINQPYTHYNNPASTYGKAPTKAKEKAKEARDEATDWFTNWTYVAEQTGRCLHYIQDAATLVHTDYEKEQAEDRTIHKSYEGWVRDMWADWFSEAVENAKYEYDGIDSGSEVKSYTLINNEKAYDALNNNWDDIKSYEDGYNYDTFQATHETIEDATRCLKGTIDWIYNG